jgi:hypothetical protein
MRTSLIIVVLLLLALTSEAKRARPIPVEFWHVGDDGLSQKLAHQVEQAWSKSSDFALSGKREPKTLVVTIPTNVDWKRIGERTRVFYTVEFASPDNTKISQSAGYCWEDAIARCAANILRDAKVAARKIH